MQRPLGAEISHMLKARGVDVIFGIPGVHSVELYRGIEEAGITHVLARHEQGAGFMADGYARATGRPGVAYVITGPGLTNILTPLGQAYSDSVAVLAISSCLDPADTGVAKGKLHEMRDQVGAAATVCDWSKLAADADAAFHLIDRALTEFQTQRARSKHIQVPISVLAKAVRPSQRVPPIVEGRHGPTKGHCAQGDVARVVEQFKLAKRPLFVFGGGAVSAADAARRVLGLTGAASFVTSAGRGITVVDDPLAFGSYLARPESEGVIGSADLVVAVGTELGETDLWREHLGHKATFVRVDIDAASLADRQNATLMVHVDAGYFLSALGDLLNDHIAATGWSAAEVAAARWRWRAGVGAEYPGVIPVMEAVRAALPPGCTVCSDMTQFAYVALEAWDMDAPGLWHHPFGFGTLGYGLPAAIGAKVGLGDRPVVAIAGDYGFQYTVQELGTAVELGLSLPILIWDNGKLKEIEDAMRRSQIAPNAVVARSPDFLALARAYGAAAVQPGSLAALQVAIREAFAVQGPTVIRMVPGLA